MADPVFIQMLQVSQITNYVVAAMGALVAYDQVITFSHEVDHIWNRQWTFMTALYFIARFSGSLPVIACAAAYMRINWTYSGLVDIYLAINWASSVFILTMQAILVIRVYAMFNKSKKVLVFLGTFYILQAIVVVVMTALVYNNRELDEYVISIGPAVGSVQQIVNYNTSANFDEEIAQHSPVPSVFFDSVLLLFALWAFVKHALEEKRLDGQWSINVLVRTLMADHLVYFVCYTTWMSLSLAANYNNYDLTLSNLLLDIVLNVFSALAVIAGPRMIISLRATENKTRGEGGTLEGEVSTIRFGVREPPTQSETTVEEGGGF